MNLKDQHTIKSLLGDDIFETLEKFEIYKPETRSVVDPSEIRVALEIVPRSVLSFLFAHLKWKDVGDIADLELPFADGAKLHIEKKGPDNYHGEVIQDGKIISKFQHRSLPSIGLILLTTFELYDVSLLDEIKVQENKEDLEAEDDNINNLQAIIDERLKMHSLVQEIVDKRISEREAISRTIRERLEDHIESIQTQEESPEEDECFEDECFEDEDFEDEGFEEEELEIMEKDKKSKLKSFLDSREEKKQECIEIDKAEIFCPDCNTSLYKAENKNKVKLCICYGESLNKEIKFKKNQNGKIKFKFPKSFDQENISMLLEALKKDVE